MSSTAEQEGFAWQTGIWDRMSETYVREIDARFVPVVEALIARAVLAPGERVLDLGSGTGSVAIRAAAIVAPGGAVLGVDPSAAMIAAAEQRAVAQGSLDSGSVRAAVRRSPRTMAPSTWRSPR